MRSGNYTRALRFASLLAAGLTAPGMVTSAWAHDFILKPTEMRVAKGKPLSVQVMLTESYFKGDRIPEIDQVKIAVVDPASGSRTTIPLASDDAGKVLAGSVDAPGSQALTVIAERAGRYRSKTPEGNKPVPKTAPGATDTVYSEAYAKALINLDGKTSAFETPAGLRLEIVPIDNPAQVRPGTAMAVKVLFENSPVQTRVQAVYEGYVSQDEKQPFVVDVETAADGTARIPISQPGLWMLRAGHTINSPTETYDRYSAKSVLMFEIE